jgi:ribose/xylose/arabinose/galactoside ABC-type transport system permease subunit
VVKPVLFESDFGMSFFAVRNIALAVLLAALLGTFWFLWPDTFGDPENFRYLPSENTELAVLSVGMTLVILTGGIDLSVAGILALAACVMGWGAAQGWGGATVCALGIATGAACGLFNSAAVSLARIPPIITTLATLYLFRGLALVLTRDKAFTGFQNLPLFQTLNASPLGQAAVMGAILAAAVAWASAATALRRICAVGGNEAVARYSGISVDRVKALAYILTGALCGAGAILYLARNLSAKADVAPGLELTVIAAVLLGGTRIQGGEGSLVGTLLGVAVLAVLQSGLKFAIDARREYWQTAIIGAIVILSAAGNGPLARWWGRRKNSS